MSVSPPVENLDVYAADTAGPRVLLAFDALDAGATILLRSAASPEAALRLLRKERAGEYEWTPLAEGPGHWEVQVQKRDLPSRLRGVTEALGWDHDRLDALERGAVRAWDTGDTRTGPRLHLQFAFGLLRHIRFEEGVLFPEFERVTGMSPDRGPTAVMRAEHRAIEPLLVDMSEAALRGVRPATTVSAELRALLHEHNVKEEKVLYPLLDRALGAEEADAVVFRFQSMDPAR